MTGFGFAALLFAVIFLGFLIGALHKASPGSGQSGAPISGRDGDPAAIRSTAPADDPPGFLSAPYPKRDRHNSPGSRSPG